MNASRPDRGPDAGAGPPRVAVFDLDGTLTWRDTLMPYLLGFGRRFPGRVLRLWRLAPALLVFACTADRGRLKAQVIRALMGADTQRTIQAWSEDFVASLGPGGRFRPDALAVLEEHRAAGDHLVLLSASPDLYVPLIGRSLGVAQTLCTELAWSGGTAAHPPGEARLTGELRTANRRGEEKAACLAGLRIRYPGSPIVAYGNSGSDLPHLKAADRALLVNADSRARRAAAACRIPVAHWS